MKVICSYCTKEIGEKEPFNDNRMSHSVCRDCHEYYSKQMAGMSFDEYLNRFDAPVFIVDEQVRILAANRKAESLLDKSKLDFIGLLCGNAMECVHARLPEGCGKTVHCLTCAIRNAVKSTMESGESQTNIPAKLKQDSEEVGMLISTEIIGSAICLKVEKID